jgi:basic membrane protein A
VNRFNKVTFYGLSLMIIAMAAFVLSGCSNNSASPSESSSAASESSGSAVKNPRVAFVYLGPPGDAGWTYQHDLGRKYMEEQLGIKSDVVENVPETADAERIMTDLAKKHDIIYATSYGYMDYTLNVAKKFPNVKFEHVNGYKTNDNMSIYSGKNYEASYLSGIVAGKMTKAKKIAYLAAFPIPQLVYNINAFTLGVQSVKPDAIVKVVWTNTWYDPTVERQAAVSALDDGADVIMAYQDSPAALQVADERGAFVGGNDSDMKKYTPKFYMTNPVWNWGPHYVKAVQAVKDGTWKSEKFYGSLADGTVDLAPFGDNIPEDVQQLVKSNKEKIISGELKLFTGPIIDQAGAEKVASGQTLTLDEILLMDWFVKGVEGTIPK